MIDCLRGGALALALLATPATAQLTRAERVMQATVTAEQDRTLGLLEAMVNRNVGVFPRTIIYLAVRIGGELGWGRVRHKKKTNRKTKLPPPTEQEVIEAISAPRS